MWLEMIDEVGNREGLGRQASNWLDENTVYCKLLLWLDVRWLEVGEKF